MSNFPKSPQEANSAELTTSDPINKVDVLNNSKSYYFTLLYGCFIQTQVIPGSHKMSCDKVTRQKTILANRQCLRVVVSRVVWRCVLVGFLCFLWLSCSAHTSSFSFLNWASISSCLSFNISSSLQASIHWDHLRWSVSGNSSPGNPGNYLKCMVIAILRHPDSDISIFFGGHD